MITLDITPADCRNAAELIELYFFQNIRDDTDIDEIDYIRSLIKVLDELKAHSK